MKTKFNILKIETPVEQWRNRNALFARVPSGWCGYTATIRDFLDRPAFYIQVRTDGGMSYIPLPKEGDYAVGQWIIVQRGQLVKKEVKKEE